MLSYFDNKDDKLRFTKKAGYAEQEKIIVEWE
jgi:hypothetical protein